MLCRDLYGDGRGPSPAERFGELATQLFPLVPDERLPEVARKFAELATLEISVRAGQVAAVARAVDLALQVERQLRALALFCQTPAKPVTR